MDQRSRADRAAESTGVAQPARLLNLGVSALNLLGAWSVENVLFRIPRLIEHILGLAIGPLQWLWRGIKRLAGIGNFTFRQWLLDGLKGTGTWLARLFTKIMDVLGFAEIVDFILQLCKSNSRQLTGAELAACQVVYGNSVSYWKIRVDAVGTGLTDFYNGILNLVAGGGGGGMIAITAFHIIELAPAHAANLNNIVHEVGHVKQYESVGSQYMGEAVCAAVIGAGYGYNAADLLAHPLRWFNREQQCRIAEHYWALQTNATIHAATVMVPSLAWVGLGPALALPAAPLVGTPLNNAIAMYQPRINEFRRGAVGGEGLTDRLYSRLRGF